MLVGMKGKLFFFNENEFGVNDVRERRRKFFFF